MTPTQQNTSTRPAKVGLVLPVMQLKGPTRRWAEIRELAEVSERIGLDSLWVVDHFLYKLEDDEPATGVWECWSVLSALAACTKTVELGTLVLGMGFRNPALLAKMADTVDEISGGRLILGLGAGYHKHEYDAFGYPYDYRVSRFEEAIEIVHGLLKTGHIDFEGRFYSARECELKPRGPRPEGPPIMIGSKSPRMLRLMGRYAEFWNAFWDDIDNRPEGLAALRPVVDAACEDVGRDPATLARTVTVLIADESAEPWWEDMPFSSGADLGALKPLMGAPAEIAAVLRKFVDEGASSIQIHLDPTTPATIEKLVPVLEAFDAG
jgi:alkanesulfonate monooxygenase SsuD/methylene tetrahydromethanopterin reductase-like flavin-dependent oxidoreductase (luciferase family)